MTRPADPGAFTPGGPARGGGLGPLAPDALDLDAARTAVAPPDRAAAAWARWLDASDIDSGPHRHLELFPLALTNLPASTMVGSDQGIVKGLTRRSWYLQQRLAGLLGPALDALDDVGAQPLLAGGLAVAWCAYPTPGARAVSGADVLVHADHAAEAEVALLALGWTAATEPSNRPEATRELRSGDGDLLRLHRWAFAHRYGGDDEGLHEAAVPVEVGAAGPRLRLGDADLLVLGLLDGLRTGQLLWLADTALLAPTVDWDVVVRRASPPAVAVRVLPALRLVAAELDVPVPGEVLVALEQVEVPLAVQVRWAADRRFRRGDRLTLYRSVTKAEGRRPSLVGYARLRRADRADPDVATGSVP
jgi:hypothetical protein